MSTSDRRRRDDARRRESATTAQRSRSRQRRMQVIAASIAIVVLLSTVAAGIAATRGTPTTSSTTTTSSPSTTATAPRSAADYPASGVAPVPATPGATLTGPTPCPAADGSSPRTTSFEQPPPLCIDPTRFYSAVVTTTAGPMTFQLNPTRAPESVNAFVVLAGYGYYDGQPITRIEPTAWFEAGGLFVDGGSADAFPIPDEVPEAGQIFTSGTIAMTGDGSPGTNRGAFLVATFENAPAIDPGVTSFGIMLDGAATLAAIDRLGSQDGLPVRPVRIESVTVTAGAAIP